jgi:DNA replication protein DnaC
MTHTADTPLLLLEHHLKELRLPSILREYDKLARQCAVEQVDYPRYLLRMTELELLDRERRATERRIRQAKFPVVKTMGSFDFVAIPTVNKTLVLELARCEFLARRENVLLLGNSGCHCFTGLCLSSFRMASMTPSHGPSLGRLIGCCRW